MVRVTRDCYAFCTSTYIRACGCKKVLSLDYPSKEHVASGYEARDYGGVLGSLKRRQPHPPSLSPPRFPALGFRIAFPHPHHRGCTACICIVLVFGDNEPLVRESSILSCDTNWVPVRAFPKGKRWTYPYLYLYFVSSIRYRI